MKVQIPGIAFGALKDSNFSQQYPGLWSRMMDYSVSLAMGRGITVHVDLSEEDWEALRACMLLLVRKLNRTPYQTRGVEGSVIMQQLQIAIGRVDDALQACDGLTRR